MPIDGLLTRWNDDRGFGFITPTVGDPFVDDDAPVRVESPSAVPKPATSFKCDGRTHCSQMTSCAEATFFLQSCPGTKMDGDNDGIPCDRQWC